jgi:hypothetical protein
MQTIDLVKCPRCGEAAQSDYDNETKEQLLICGSCGYLLEDRIGENESAPTLRRRENKPVGLCYIERKLGDGEEVPLPDSKTEPVEWGEIFSKFDQVMKDPNVAADKCFLTRYDEQTRKVVTILGSRENHWINSGAIGITRGQFKDRNKMEKAG